MMEVIGLTGQIASGKSTVSAYLRQKGFAVVDADEIAHEVIRRGGRAYAAVVRQFGTEFVGAEGEIDRRKLGQAVFADPEKLAQLNAITHPCICAEIRARLAAQRGTVFLDAPLLVQAGLDTLCGEIWQVTAADDIRLGRIQVRDGLDADEARARMQSQVGVRMPTDRLVHTIDNSSDTAALYRQIDRLLAGRTPYENA